MKSSFRLFFSALLAAFLLCSAFSAPALGEERITTRNILTGMSAIKPVNCTHYLLVQSPDTQLWGVYDTSGELIIHCVFPALAYGEYDCFVASHSSKALDNLSALVSPGGRFVSDYRYGIVKVYNDRWAAGWVVSQGDKKNYDYTPDKKHFYNIELCDIFYLGDTPRKIGTFSRDAFAQAAAHGDYLSVKDRAGNITVYDQKLQPTNLKVSKISENIYGVVRYALMDKAANKILLDGFTAAKEVNTRRGLLFQLTRTDFSGNKQMGVCTLNGEWLMPLGSYTIASVSENYAVISENERFGLYSYSLGRVVVPCEYEGFPTSKQTVDPYECNGYVSAVKNGMRCFVCIESGEITSSIPDGSPDYTVIGSTVYEQLSTNRYRFTSPTGKKWSIGDSSIGQIRGDGRLIVFRSIENNNYGVYTQDGTLALEAKYRNEPIITDDGKVILNTLASGYNLLDVAW